ncbi:MAG: hypothetical protein ACPGES_00025 [Coraliomargarita sp.]
MSIITSPRIQSMAAIRLERGDCVELAADDGESVGAPAESVMG